MIDNVSYYYHRDEASGLGITIHGCGSLFRTGTDALAPRRTLDCYALVYLYRGSGMLHSELTKPLRVTAGHTFVLFPGVWHRYGPGPREHWGEYWYIFDGPTVRHWQRKAMICPEVPVFSLPSPSSLVEGFTFALDCAADPDRVGELVPSLFGLLHRTLQVKESSQIMATDPVGRLITEVEQRPALAWNFPAEARRRGMSYSSLRRSFKTVTGVPPHRFLNRERMRLARELLAAGYSVKETCARVGMVDPYHFSRLFKQLTGQAPKSFAKARQSWTHEHGESE